jgi:hypothetical protein
MGIALVVLKAVGGFIARNYEVILVGLLVTAVLLFCYASGRNHERAVWKPRVTELREELRAIERDHEEASKRAEAEVAEIRQRAAVMNEEERSRYETRILTLDSRVAALLGSLRDARKVRPLAPSSAAPAACRDYEADRSRLPDSDREFLIGEAATAAACVVQLGSCQSYAVRLHALCNRE